MDSFFLISGPCAVESEDMVMETAGRIKEICDTYNIPYIFKASYRKANRSKLSSFSGIGDDLALSILKKVKDEYGIAITTDIHESEEVPEVAEIVDILQIPAFLCRQTALLLAAAKSGRLVNIKKGQFMAPHSMKYAVDKVRSVSDRDVWLTERGTTFGYGDLVVDFRGIPEMKEHSDKVVMDCTHSLQRPNTKSGVTGGSPEYISLMARTALAAGADGLFIETHPQPSKALSDGANMLPLDRLEELLVEAVAIKEAMR